MFYLYGLSLSLDIWLFGVKVQTRHLVGPQSVSFRSCSHAVLVLFSKANEVLHSVDLFILSHTSSGADVNSEELVANSCISRELSIFRIVISPKGDSNFIIKVSCKPGAP